MGGKVDIGTARLRVTGLAEVAMPVIGLASAGWPGCRCHGGGGDTPLPVGRDAGATAEAATRMC